MWPRLRLSHRCSVKAQSRRLSRCARRPSLSACGMGTVEEPFALSYAISASPIPFAGMAFSANGRPKATTNPRSPTTLTFPEELPGSSTLLRSAPDAGTSTPWAGEAAAMAFSTGDSWRFSACAVDAWPISSAAIPATAVVRDRNGIFLIFNFSADDYWMPNRWLGKIPRIQDSLTGGRSFRRKQGGRTSEPEAQATSGPPDPSVVEGYRQDSRASPTHYNPP